VPGRIDPAKNQGWLIEQLPELCRRHPKLLLVLAGAATDGPYARALERRIEELGQRGNVLLTGGLPPADPRLIGLYQKARAVVLPSLAETFGLVILEAWAAGTPVVASRTAGATSLIEDGKNGLLYDIDDAAQLGAAVDPLWQDAEIVARLGSAGLRSVAEYDADTLAGSTEQLYRELAERSVSATRGKFRIRGPLASPSIRSAVPW
jgi:glycosyltransferase involved in cell wall biosynthesis